MEEERETGGEERCFDTSVYIYVCMGSGVMMQDLDCCKTMTMWTSDLGRESDVVFMFTFVPTRLSMMLRCGPIISMWDEFLQSKRLEPQRNAEWRTFMRFEKVVDALLAAIRSPVILFAFEVVFLKVRRAFSFLQMLSICVYHWICQPEHIILHVEGA